MQFEIEQQIVEEIRARSEAWENLLVLVDDIGIRVAGSEGEAQARDFLLAKLQSYGLDDVHLESFPHRAWHSEREVLTVVAPAERTIACRCAGLSPSPPKEGLEGGVVFLESCASDALEALSEAEHGARACDPPLGEDADEISTCGCVGRCLEGVVLLLRCVPLPVASISLEDAEYLKRLQERKGQITVRLTLDSRIERKDSWNVVGQLTGTEKPDECIVIGGHYDTWHVGPGAIDNASGVVAALEAARALAKFREHLPRTVRFVLFGVEESGLVGSWAYTKEHEAELDDTILMINNDVGGRPNGIGISGFEEFRTPLEEVAERVEVEGLDEDRPFSVSVGGASWGSDHFPFVVHGVPTIGMGAESVVPEDRLYGHSRADTADKVYEQGLSESAAINAQVILQIANLPERPAQRRTQEQVETFFRAHDSMETLALLQVWPPDVALDRYFNI